MKLDFRWYCKGNVQDMKLEDNFFMGYEEVPCNCMNLTPTLNKKRKRIWVSLDCPKCGKSYTFEEVERRLKSSLER